jgi:predicted HTH transcriptional regulator
MLSSELNEYLDSFIYKEGSDVDVKALIQQGECQNIEFKSSIRWDYKENTVNKKLEFVIAKTLCGFLNSDGGTLIIGVDDNGNVLGLDKDYSTLSKNDKDGFQLALNNIINTYLGKDIWVDINIVPCDNKDVCVIKANPSKRSVFVKNEGKEEFYIRRGSGTTPLSFSEMEKYILERK